MPRMSRRDRYMRDRAARKRYDYAMGSRDSRSEYDSGYDSARGRDRHYPEERYMETERYRQPRRYYDMRSRDYTDEYEKEYEEDLEDWIEKLKKDDRFGLSKEQVITKAKEMKADFKEYDKEEFYAIYLMHVSDYPSVANEPHTYIAMAKAWLDDPDLEIEPSEKVCKYLYEIVLADED